MSEIRVGMLVRDNDPQMPDRALRVIAVGNETAVLLERRRGFRDREVRIALRRIHTDGKPRKTEWSVVG